MYIIDRIIKNISELMFKIIIRDWLFTEIALSVKIDNNKNEFIKFTEEMPERD